MNSASPLTRSAIGIIAVVLGAHLSYAEEQPGGTKPADQQHPAEEKAKEEKQDKPRGDKIAMEQTPAAVASTVAAVTNNAVPIEVLRRTNGKKVTYIVGITSPEEGKVEEFQLSEDGKVLKHRVRDAEKEAGEDDQK